MRWIKKNKPAPTLYGSRVRKRFLLLPKNINDVVCWLEWGYWRETWKCINHNSGYINRSPTWKPIPDGWITKEEYYEKAYRKKTMEVYDALE